MLSVRYYNDGGIFGKIGRDREALESFRKDLAIVEEQAAADSSNLWKRAAVIEADGKTAKTLAKASEGDAALAKGASEATLWRGRSLRRLRGSG